MELVPTTAGCELEILCVLTRHIDQQVPPPVGAPTSESLHNLFLVLGTFPLQRCFLSTYWIFFGASHITHFQQLHCIQYTSPARQNLEEVRSVLRLAETPPASPFTSHQPFNFDSTAASPRDVYRQSTYFLKSCLISKGSRSHLPLRRVPAKSRVAISSQPSDIEKTTQSHHARLRPRKEEGEKGGLSEKVEYRTSRRITRTRHTYRRLFVLSGQSSASLFVPPPPPPSSRVGGEAV